MKKILKIFKENMYWKHSSKPIKVSESSFFFVDIHEIMSNESAEDALNRKKFITKYGI